MFSISDIYRNANDGSLWLEILQIFELSTFIGDPAYLLLTWLMKLYGDSGRLSPEERTTGSVDQETYLKMRLAASRVVGGVYLSVMTVT